MSAVGTDSVVHDNSDFCVWVAPSVEVDCMAMVSPPFFYWLVLGVELDRFREELLEFFPTGLGFICWE